ncbi:alpha/beta hydrolase family esterase [Planotetraspora kaengkrachanensis]|uniref:Esterase n=1 Tax=Planotetraspora kaengkrachanensis TaxID=575193 RepID=A0A8J3V5P9_9ACTN|nr:PHB depolymerase family esterase [Planotetraspora kaengkrachanensis]GIG81190.1 esterase [Planotetraspora kaengkrachanensis]
MRRISAVLVAIGVATAACSSPAPERPEPSQPQPTRSVAGRPSTGCGQPVPTGGRTQVTVDGRRLDYLLSMPAGFTNTTPAPVVLDFHGLGSNAAQENAYTRLSIAGPNLGYVVVTPETASGLAGWIIPGFGGVRPGDQDVEVKAAAALLDHLEATLCVDRTREFAAGMSNGAGMAAALVCGLNGRLAAVAPVSGITIAKPCARPTPTTIITFHGTADRVVPFEGGQVGLPGRIGGVEVPAWLREARLPSFETTVDRWAESMDCGPGTRSEPAGDVVLRTFRCAGGSTVEAYVVEGGGHTWPGGIPLARLGKTARLDATGLILQAFTRYPARR